MRAAASAAFAAASCAAADLSPFAGLSSTLLIGLRSRASESFLSSATGERERRSKRDLRAGSGSVWSKRDRLRPVSSDMLAVLVRVREYVLSVEDVLSKCDHQACVEVSWVVCQDSLPSGADGRRRKLQFFACSAGREKTSADSDSP